MKVKPHSVIPLPQTEYVYPLHDLIHPMIHDLVYYLTELFMLLFVSGERDGVEIITTGVSRLSKESDRTSTGSTRSTGS